MNWRVVSALVVKDFTLFFRNRFFAFVSIAGLVAYVAIYLVMPSSVDETLKIGLYAPVIPPVLTHLQEEEGLSIETIDSQEALREAVGGGQYQAGIVLPGDSVERLMAGQKTHIDVYFAPDVPEELKDAVIVFIREVAYLQSGGVLNIEVSSEVLGRDMVGMQIPPRDRMLPLIAVFMLLTETLGLASLISEEIAGHTIQALLVTPMTVRGLFLAKGITGVVLAFGQVALFMAATRSLDNHPLLILVALLLGSLLVTGIGFLLASLGKDLISVMGWGIPAIIVLSIPSFGVLLPGMTTDWVKIIPSHYLVETIHQAANFGSGWGDLWRNLLVLLGFDVLFVGLGILVLRRKLR